MGSRGLGLTALALALLLGAAVVFVGVLGDERPPTVAATPAANAARPASATSAAVATSSIGVNGASAAGAPAVVGGASPSAAASAADQAGSAPSEDTTWLLSQLRSGQAFRVRAAAALALGRRRGARVEAGLIEALRDEHPAVRTAAASALSRFGGAHVKTALQQAHARERDAVAARALGRAHDTPVPRPATPAPAAKGGVYVSVSKPRAQGGLDAQLLERADSVARAQARRLPGARIAPLGESASAAEAVLRSEGRMGFQLDVTLGVEAVSGGARATANVLVASYPGRSIRGFAKGAATAGGNPADPELQRMAIEHAIASAFSDLPRMFESSGP
jgi:hypothetical protein